PGFQEVTLVVVAFRSSHPVCPSHPYPELRSPASKAKYLRLNILHVSTFTAKILRAATQIQLNELKDLAGPTGGTNARKIRFPQLSPALSRFYLQLLLIQRFCPCSPSNLMIPKDRVRGISHLSIFRTLSPDANPLWVLYYHQIF